jgi:hypothetical protein
MRRILLVVVVAACAIAGAHPVRADAQKPQLEDVLARVSAYVGDYVPRLINLVAVERYEQQRSVKPVQSRRLLSDFLLVAAPTDETRWMFFRDVTEVDGQPVPDKAERVIDLFVSPSSNAVERARQIAADSQRFHYPGASFNLTNPLAVITALQPVYQPKLDFDLGDEDPAFGPGVRVLRFEEPSLMLRLRNSRTAVADPLFAFEGAKGRVWVDAATGRVLQTEWRQSLGPRTSPSSVTTFRMHERFRIMVPDEMRTRWADTQAKEITGVARYSDYRRFEVNTDTELQLPAFK